MSVSYISLTAKFLKKNKFYLLIASLWPTLFNGVIIGWMLNFVLGVPIFITMLQVAIGEFVVVTILGVSIAIIIKRKYGNKLSLI